MVHLIQAAVLFMTLFMLLGGCSSFNICLNRGTLRLKRNSFLQAALPPIPELTPEKKLFFSQKSFESLGLSPTMIQCASTLGITQPSKIQALASYGISSGKACIIADQTGSGKTLAYLLPTVQKMIDERRNEKGSVKRVSPYIVVMAPTAELANQVSKVVKTLANGLKFRTACFTSLCDLDAERKKLRLGTDVLISTPGRLLQLIKDEEVNLSELNVMVLDEADVLLLDESFPLQPIGQACKHSTSISGGGGGSSSASSEESKTLNAFGEVGVDKTASNKGGKKDTKQTHPSISATTTASTSTTTSTTKPTPILSETQFLFVTATLPDVVVSQIESEFPEVMTLKGPGLHRIASSVEEVLVDCSGTSEQERSSAQVMLNKRNALLEALDNNPVERTLVFCNTIDQCRKVENILQRDDRGGKDRTVLSYHGAVDGKTRDENLRAFSKQLLQVPVVLISTDRASRGLDFNQAQVDHVILYDFPQEPSEYLRRVGRTGRAGRKGKATILVYGKQVPAARAVRKAGIEGKRIQPSDSL